MSKKCLSQRGEPRSRFAWSIVYTQQAERPTNNEISIYFPCPAHGALSSWVDPGGEVIGSLFRLGVENRLKVLVSQSRAVIAVFFIIIHINRVQPRLQVSHGRPDIAGAFLVLAMATRLVVPGLTLHLGICRSLEMVSAYMSHSVRFALVSLVGRARSAFGGKAPATEAAKAKIPEAYGTRRVNAGSFLKAMSASWTCGEQLHADHTANLFLISSPTETEEQCLDIVIHPTFREANTNTDSGWAMMSHPYLLRRQLTFRFPSSKVTMSIYPCGSRQTTFSKRQD